MTPANPASRALHLAYRALGHCLTLLSLLIAACTPAWCAGAFAARVVVVVDGDTLVVRDDRAARHEVRIAGIDAPEIRQAFGVRSRSHLAELVYGKRVSVAWYKRDRYGRLIAEVTVGGPAPCSAPPCPAVVDAGQAQIAVGLAWHDKLHLDEQNVESRLRYSRAEMSARAQRLGLWSATAPLAPWHYRHRYDRNR